MSYMDQSGNILDNKGMSTGLRKNSTGQIVDTQTGISTGYSVNNMGNVVDNKGINAGAGFNSFGQLTSNQNGMNTCIDHYMPKNDWKNPSYEMNNSMYNPNPRLDNFQRKEESFLPNQTKFDFNYSKPDPVFDNKFDAIGKNKLWDNQANNLFKDRFKLNF